MSNIRINPTPEFIEEFIKRSARKGNTFRRTIAALAGSFDIDRLANDGAYLILENAESKGRIILSAYATSAEAFIIVPVRTTIEQDWQITCHLETPARLLQTIALAIEA